MQSVDILGSSEVRSYAVGRVMGGAMGAAMGGVVGGAS